MFFDQDRSKKKIIFATLVRSILILNLFGFLLISRAPDLTSQILQILNEFVYQLVCSGQLMMAKLLRNKILEKVYRVLKMKKRPQILIKLFIFSR